MNHIKHEVFDFHYEYSKETLTQFIQTRIDRLDITDCEDIGWMEELIFERNCIQADQYDLDTIKEMLAPYLEDEKETCKVVWATTTPKIEIEPPVAIWKDGIPF